MDLELLRDLPPWEWPEDAAQRLLEVLTDEQAEPDRRLIAAELAGDYTVIDDPLAEALLAIASSSDHPEELRAQAAIALGPVLEDADTQGFDEPGDAPIDESTFENIQHSLEALYRDAAAPDSVRRSALEASVRAPEDWHLEAVSSAWDSADPGWKLTAVFSMRWLKGFENEILGALRSDDDKLHYEAVCAAGSWQLDEAWSHVSQLVDDPTADKELRLAAIEAASSIRPDEAGRLLADLVDDEDEDIAEAANDALAMAEMMAAAGDELEDELEDKT